MKDKKYEEKAKILYNTLQNEVVLGENIPYSWEYIIESHDSEDTIQWWIALVKKIQV